MNEFFEEYCSCRSLLRSECTDQLLFHHRDVRSIEALFEDIQPHKRLCPTPMFRKSPKSVRLQYRVPCHIHIDPRSFRILDLHKIMSVLPGLLPEDRTKVFRQIDPLPLPPERANDWPVFDPKIIKTFLKEQMLPGTRSFVERKHFGNGPRFSPRNFCDGLDQRGQLTFVSNAVVRKELMYGCIGHTYNRSGDPRALEIISSPPAPEYP